MADCTCADPGAVVDAINKNTEQRNKQNNTDSDKIMRTLASTGDVTQPRATVNNGGQKAVKVENGKRTEVGTGKDGVLSAIQHCHWNAPEYGMTGSNWWSNLMRAAGLAIAIANGIAQSEIADKQYDLANKWYNQAKFKWDRFKNKYMPLEKKLLNEVSSVPIRHIDCQGAQDRAEASVNTAYASTAIYMKQQAKKLRLCLDPSLISAVNQKQNVMLVDAENFNLTDERWFTDYKNDQRWNRRSNVLNLGRNLSSESMQYGRVANQLYGQIGAQLNQAANGLMQAVGYYGARNDTYYSTTYLNTNALSDPASGVIMQGAGTPQ